MLAPIGVMRARRPRRPVSYQSHGKGRWRGWPTWRRSVTEPKPPACRILRLRLSETCLDTRRWISAGKHPRPHHRPSTSPEGLWGTVAAPGTANREAHPCPKHPHRSVPRHLRQPADPRARTPRRHAQDDPLIRPQTRSGNEIPVAIGQPTLTLLSRSATGERPLAHRCRGSS